MPLTDNGKDGEKAGTSAPGSAALNPSSPQVVVDQLTTVIRDKAGQELYIGWGPDGSPALAMARQALSPTAQDILRVYDRARNLVILQLPIAKIVPVEYSYIKLHDLGGSAEDYFLVNCKDSKGRSKQFRVGELELLEGIANARYYLQDTSAAPPTGERIVYAQPLYTVLTPCFELDERNAWLAILFKPPVENAPQEATFQYFVVEVLRVLWQNDMKDEPQIRKGYYDAVQRYLSPSQTRVPLLLRMAFTSEDTAREKWDAFRRWVYKKPGPSSTGGQVDGLGDLDMPALLSLATTMRDSARAYFQRNAR